MSTEQNPDSQRQVVKLIFAAKQKREKGQVLRVSIKNQWVYEVQKSPLFTIGMTLKKFKIAKTSEDQQEMAKKYRVYRVREDPKTKYRYVTEILNQEEGRQLINKKYCQILICHHSLVRNPQEDFKNILDEAERRQIRLAEEQKEQIENNPDGKDGELKKEITPSQEQKEPATQSSAPSQGASQPTSQSSSQESAKEQKNPVKYRRNMGQKRISGGSGGGNEINDHERGKLTKLYPKLEFTGKNNELYKCSDVLNQIKELSTTSYANMGELEKKLIRELNKTHNRMTGSGNNAKGDKDTIDEIYSSKETPSYINVRCAISKKCRFAMWYKFDKSGDDRPINIKWFRTINNNHDLKFHKEAGIY